MRNSSSHRALVPLLERARYEVIPTATDRVADLVLEHVPRDLTVTVTASPGKGLGATLDLAERLAREGYDAVPHLAARMISGRAELTEICDRLVPLGVRTVFVPAGDVDPPVGDYRAALDLLRDLPDLGSPFPHIGITGYPTSHPSIDDDLTISSMGDKLPHATHIVSNMSFDPEAIGDWLRRLRARDVRLPVLVGMPGAVEPARLLAVAARIGVGQSTRFLARNRRTALRLATPGGFDAEAFLEGLAPEVADAALGVEGLHVYTFNQLARTERWRREHLDRWRG